MSVSLIVMGAACATAGDMAGATAWAEVAAVLLAAATALLRLPLDFGV